MRDELVRLSEDLHAVSRQLHPSVVDDLGLVEALRSECTSFSRREGIAVAYRPRSRAASADELAAELAERLDADLERGYTGHGPHRDDLALRRDGRDLRSYGSQGEQRLALLALLLAEREALAERRRMPPLMLLDDVMSELDGHRRHALVELLRASGGQSVITATDSEQVPSATASGVKRLAVSAGTVLGEAVAA